MIGIFELTVMLAAVVIMGFTSWIWKSKPNWSTLKKAVITILFSIGSHIQEVAINTNDF